MFSIKKSMSVIVIFLFISINFGFSEPSIWAKEHYFLMNYEGVLNDNLKASDGLQKNITREEFADLVVNLYSKATRKNVDVFSQVNPFTDTNNIMVSKAYNIGLVKGVGDNLFQPKAQVTREQMAVMLYNMINVLSLESNGVKNKVFSDENEVSFWAEEAIDFAIAENVLSGVGNNLISPKTWATREQAIVMISRLGQKYNWIEEVSLSEDQREISDFLIPDEDKTNVLAYNPSDETLDIRIVSKVVTPDVLNIKKQHFEIVDILDSNPNINYKNIVKIADIINKGYDSVEKRYNIPSTVIINGYYQYKIYGTDNLTIDCKKR